MTIRLRPEERSTGAGEGGAALSASATLVMGDMRPVVGSSLMSSGVAVMTNWRRQSASRSSGGPSLY